MYPVSTYAHIYIYIMNHKFKIYFQSPLLAPRSSHLASNEIASLVPRPSCHRCNDPPDPMLQRNRLRWCLGIHQGQVCQNVDLLGLGRWCSYNFISYKKNWEECQTVHGSWISEETLNATAQNYWYPMAAWLNTKYCFQIYGSKMTHTNFEL